MSRSSLTLILATALLAGGCDRGARDASQESRETPEEISAGQIDRSRAGEMMPAVNLSSEQGEVLNMGALQGTPVLLNLWATWCAPCVKEMPALDTLAAEYGGRLRVVAASQDAQGSKVVIPFFEQARLDTLEPWLDPENLLMDGLEVDVLPVTILYDSMGREIWRMVGPYDWASEEAFALIDESVSPIPVPPGA